MLVHGILLLVSAAAVVIQASRVNDEFFQEVRDLLERKEPQRDDGEPESNEVQAEVMKIDVMLALFPVDDESPFVLIFSLFFFFSAAISIPKR